MVTHRIDGVIFDLDGTLYLGEEALPGAVDTCRELRHRGKRLLFVSNKPLQTRRDYAEKLTGLGIPASADEVITSTYVLGLYLRRTNPDLRLYVIGEENTRNELRGYGLIVLPELSDQDPQDVMVPKNIDAVVVAFDRTLDYRKINTAYQALINGAHFFATNADKACPMPGGSIPDAGATIKALEHITGRSVELVAGKPSALILQEAGKYLQLSPDACIMVGDRIETDIRMGVEAGMHTGLVLTGVTRREHLSASTVQPELILENVSELLDFV